MSTPEDVAGEAAVDPGNGEGAITHRLVEEMVPFLRDPRPEIRQAAAATAVAASATKEGVTLLHECGAVKWLCRISGDVGTIAKDAVSALVNVSAEDTSVAALEDMCKAGIVSRMMDTVSSQDCLPLMRDLCLQLLANVTRVQVGATKLAQVGVAGGAKEGHYIQSLARSLSLYPAEAGRPYPTLIGRSRDDARVVDRRAAVRDSYGDDGGDDGGDETGPRPGDGGPVMVLDQWQHCASVLCNAARIAEGRRALRKPAPKVALSQLLAQLPSPNPAFGIRSFPFSRDGILVRRWGIAGCIRNCCFEELDHPWLLHEVKVVPHLLMRLSDDGDEYDFDEKVILDPRVWKREEDSSPRRREPVECIKRDVVEALLQLCAILESRQSLRKMGVYFVIREMDKSEPDGEISQVCYNLVNFLQRDEQDRQGRVDFLKNLADSEAKDEHVGEGQDKAKKPELEIMPAPGPPGTKEDRTAYVRNQLASEKSGGVSTKKGGVQSGVAGAGGSVEGDEEFVGDAGTEAMTKMLSSFDDSDEE